MTEIPENHRTMMVRAYRIATTAPMEPVLITADIELQEDAIEHEQKLKLPKLTRTIQAQGERGRSRKAPGCWSMRRRR